MQGVGSYDRFAIEWGYSTGVPDQTQDFLPPRRGEYL